MVTPNTTDAVQYRIIAWMERESLSVAKLAALSEVSEGALRNIRKPTWRPSWTIVKRLEDLIPQSFNVDLTREAP